METENITFEQRLESIEKQIDGIFDSKKLDFTPSDTEIDEIFSLGAENLAKLPSQKLSEYAFILSRYIVGLQRDLNKKKTKINWAKRRLDYIVLNSMADYRSGYMTAEEVKMKATRGNDVAIKLYQFISEEEVELLSLSDLTFDIRKMSDSLVEISKTKRFQNA
jgi:hypothetical protein